MSVGALLVLPGVAIQALQGVGVDAADHSRREQSLEHPADTTAPSHMVAIRTLARPLSGVTVHVVIRLELVSDSVRTRPGGCRVPAAGGG